MLVQYFLFHMSGKIAFFNDSSKMIFRDIVTHSLQIFIILIDIMSYPWALLEFNEFIIQNIFIWDTKSYEFWCLFYRWKEVICYYFYGCAYWSKKVIGKFCFFTKIWNKITINKWKWYCRDLFIIEETI